MANRIQIRRDSEENWVDADPVLADGELGLNYDNNQIKIGDGTNTWTSLSYSGSSTGNVTFSDQVIVGTGDIDGGGSGLYLSPGANSTANLQYLRVRGGDDSGHIHLDTGNNTIYDQFFGNDNKYLKLEAGDTGNIVISTDGTYEWQFGSNGNLTLPQGTTISEATNIVTVTLDQLTAISAWTGTLVFTKVSDTLYQALPSGPTMELVVGIWRLRSNTATYYDSTDLITWGTVAGSLPAPVGTTEILETMNLTVGSNVWTFGDDGNLTLPGNAFAVNYANGTQVSIGGGGNANTGNITFDDNIVIGTGDEFGSTGLYLAPGNASIANSAVQYLRVRGGDVATHIHLDTGNNAYFDQYFGDDDKYVKLANTGNVVIGTDDANGNSAQWTFGTDGNLTTPSNLVIGTGAGSGSRIFQYDDGLEIVGEGANSVVLMGWTANISAPDSVATIAMNYPSGGEGNILIAVGNNATTVHSWLFGNDGDLKLPAGGDIVDSTGTSVLGGGAGGGIALTDLSIGTDGTPTGGGNISYANSTGVFTYTPPVIPDVSGFALTSDIPDVSGFVTGTPWTSAGYLTTITNIFNQDLNTTNNVTFSSVITSNVQATNGSPAVASPVAVGGAGSLLTISAGDGGIAATGVNAGAGGNLTITAGDAGSDIGNPSWGEIGGTLVIRGGNSSRPYHGSDVQIHSGNAVASPGAISLYTGTNQWTFGKTGNLTLPVGGNILDSTGTSVLFSGDYTDLTNKPTILAEPAFSVQTTDFNATAGSRYGFDTTTGVVTATLPASPATGDAIYFADASGTTSTNNFIIARNSQTIMGSASNMTVNVNDQSFGLFYNGTTWRVY